MTLLQDKASAQSPQPLVEAAIRLCDELTSSGEPLTALSILAELESMGEPSTPETTVKAMTAKVGVLNSLGRYAEALALAETTESTYVTLLQRLPETAHYLQIQEGASLWMLNRPDDAVRKLAKVRERLLTQPY